MTFAPASLPSHKLMDQKLVAVRSIFPNAEDMKNGFLMPQISDSSKKTIVSHWQKLKAGN